MALESNVQSFLKQYVTPSTKVRYFTKSQLFVAYRSFLARTRPKEIMTMDYDIFNIEFQDAVTNLTMPTKNHGKTIYYKLYIGSQPNTTNVEKKVDQDQNQIKLKLNETNIFICCKLCCGYLVEATTITECLHSFCKSCIVKHFSINKFCPVCGINVHQRNPLSSLKLDQVLQDIVNIILPGNEINEQNKILAIEKTNKTQTTDKTDVELAAPYVMCTIYLEWVGKEKCTLPSENLVCQYIKTSNKATIAHVAQFILLKLDKLDNESNPTVSCAVSCGGVELPFIFTLENITKNNLDFVLKNGAICLQYDLQPLEAKS